MKTVFWQKKSLSSQRLYFICQQLSFALAGGMSLPMALSFVGSDMRYGNGKQFLLQLAEQVQQGRSFVQALQQSDSKYSPVLLEFAMVGELNGSMETAMKQAAEYFQRQDKIKQLLFSALTYPMVILLLMLLALGAMLLLVVPAVVQTYHNFQAPLPAATKLVLICSAWFQQYWLVVLLVSLLGVFGAFLLLYQMGRYRSGRVGLRKALQKVPVAGSLYQQYWFVQFIQALGLLLSGGMLLVDCLYAIQNIHKRSLFVDDLQQLADEVAAGVPFWQAMERCSLFPAAARQVLAVSEQTGRLALAVAQLSQYYEQQLQQRLQVAGKLLEPCFIVLLGGMVLVLAGSLFLPLVQSYQYLL
ncbi:MAG: type II secretion system F family protein [Peptococcaceae bacterium]